MIQIFEFIIQSFWHWMGTVILLMVICPWNRVVIGRTRKEGDG